MNKCFSITLLFAFVISLNLFAIPPKPNYGGSQPWDKPLADSGRDNDFEASFSNGGNIVFDKATGLTWQARAKGNIDWYHAWDHCLNLSYAGRDDWRLPTPFELLTLSDFSKSDPAIYKPFGDPKWDGDHVYFWSDSDNTGIDVPSWDDRYVLSPRFGGMTYETIYQGLSALCVAGKTPKSQYNARNRYDDKKSHIVDLKTGLMWGGKRESNSSDYVVWKTWRDAQTYCGKLKNGGYKDWRLPTITELLSIVNLDKSRPCSDLPGMGRQLNPFWTINEFDWYPNRAWTIQFSSAQITYYDTNIHDGMELQVICTRTK